MYALVIGGTGFVGRHTVAELLDHGYGVTSMDRGAHGFRFGGRFPSSGSPPTEPTRTRRGRRTCP